MDKFKKTRFHVLSYMSHTFLSVALFGVDEESTESVSCAACNYCLVGIRYTLDHDLIPGVELSSRATG